MKTLVAALFATTFIAAPAFACGMKSAETKTMTTAKVEAETEVAISTFDPAETPVFETAASDADTIDTGRSRRLGVSPEYNVEAGSSELAFFDCSKRSPFLR